MKYLYFFQDPATVLSYSIMSFHHDIFFFVLLIIALVYWNLYVIIKNYSWYFSTKQRGFFRRIYWTYYLLELEIFVFTHWWNLFSFTLRPYFNFIQKTFVISIKLEHNSYINKKFRKIFFYFNAPIIYRGQYFPQFLFTFDIEDFGKLFVDRYVSFWILNHRTHSYVFNDLNDNYLNSKKFKHSLILEFVFAFFPTVIVGLIVVPSMYLLYSLDEEITPALTVKVVGHQWYWSYQWNANIFLDKFITKENIFTNYIPFSELFRLTKAHVTVRSLKILNLLEITPLFEKSSRKQKGLDFLIKLEKMLIVSEFFYKGSFKCKYLPSFLYDFIDYDLDELVTVMSKPFAKCFFMPNRSVSSEHGIFNYSGPIDALSTEYAFDYFDSVDFLSTAHIFNYSDFIDVSNIEYNFRKNLKILNLLEITPPFEKSSRKQKGLDFLIKLEKIIIVSEFFYKGKFSRNFIPLVLNQYVNYDYALSSFAQALKQPLIKKFMYLYDYDAAFAAADLALFQAQEFYYGLNILDIYFDPTLHTFKSYWKKVKDTLQLFGDYDLLDLSSVIDLTDFTKNLIIFAKNNEFFTYKIYDNYTFNHNVEIDSVMIKDSDLSKGYKRLLTVDNSLILPAKTTIRFVILLMMFYILGLCRNLV